MRETGLRTNVTTGGTRLTLRVLAGGWLLALSCAAFLAVGVASASGSVASRWERSTVTYRNHSPWPGSLKLAVSWWNQTPGSVRLVEARRGGRADINVFAATLDAGTAGLAWYPPVGKVLLDRGAMREAPWTIRADYVAHELGHALGLPHVALRCALMSGVSYDWDLCERGVEAGWVRCGPRRPDARALVQQYGGRLGLFDGFLCRDPFDEGAAE